MAAEARLTEAELVRWGISIGATVERPVVIALHGDLGAGKSTLARAVARGAGVEGPVPSPTFNLLHRYSIAAGSVVHLDLYRLEREEDAWELGWSELGGEGELVLIEWAENAATILPEPRWELTLLDEGDPTRRRVEMRAVGDPAPLPPVLQEAG